MNKGEDNSKSDALDDDDEGEEEVCEEVNIDEEAASGGHAQSNAEIVVHKQNRNDPGFASQGHANMFQSIGNISSTSSLTMNKKKVFSSLEQPPLSRQFKKAVGNNTESPTARIRSITEKKKRKA